MPAGIFQHFYARDPEYVTIDELLAWVRAHPLPDGRCIPVCIWGSRGIGKTSQVKSFCQENGLEIIIYHPAHDVSGQDIVGQPIVDEETGRVTYATPEFLPAGDQAGKGVWFIDEINRGNDAVLAGLMEPLGEGTISQSGWKIPEDWQIVVAANPHETEYLVKPLDVAMVSRMLHYNPGWEPAVWANWAGQSGIHPDVVQFAVRRPDILAVGSGQTEFQIPPEIEPKIVANPRSMEYFSALYDPEMPLRLLRAIGYGLIGRQATDTFMEERANRAEVLSAEQILSEPITAPGQAPIYDYESYLANWQTDSDRYSRAVNGTVQLLASELLRKDPPTGPLENNRRAQLAGRFISRLLPEQQSAALGTIQRACPAWHPSIKEATSVWIKHAASEGQLLSS
jgi:hypothetical protein